MIFWPVKILILGSPVLAGGALLINNNILCTCENVLFVLLLFLFENIYKYLHVEYMYIIIPALQWSTIPAYVYQNAKTENIDIVL